jgi:hypothetical protein
MCGISGIISLGKNQHLLPNIVRMTDVIRHRGPDDEGFAFFGRGGAIDIYGGKDTPESVYSGTLPYYQENPIRKNIQAMLFLHSVIVVCRSLIFQRQGINRCRMKTDTCLPITERSTTT